MTAGLVGQNQITTFVTPVNGTSPIDANQVRGNDNTIKTTYDLHDSDSTIHFQSSLAAGRPAAGTAGRKWINSDTLRVYYDNGVSWDEIAYLQSGGGTITGALAITSNSAVALAVGRLGATTPAFTVDASTASQVAGLKVTGAGTGGTVTVVATDSGADTSLTINAKGAGTIGIGSVSTGAVTITPNTTIAGTLGITGLVTASANVRISTTTAAQLQFYNSGFGVKVTSGSGLTEILSNGASALSITNSGAASTFVGTATATRVIASTDIGSAVAPGVFGSGTYNSSPDANITAIFGSVTYTTGALSSGTHINHKTQVIQPIATTGAVYGSHNTALATHTSGTVNLLRGLNANVYCAGVGGTTTQATALDVNAIVSASVTATTLRMIYAEAPTISGTVTTAVGLDVGNISGAGTNYAIRTGVGGVLVGDTLQVNGITTLVDNLNVGSPAKFTVTASTGAVVTNGSFQAVGLVQTAASATGSAGLNLPHGAAPSAPVNGDLWTTTAGLFVRINGVTVGPLS